MLRLIKPLRLTEATPARTGETEQNHARYDPFSHAFFFSLEGVCYVGCQGQKDKSSAIDAKLVSLRSRNSLVPQLACHLPLSKLRLIFK